MKKHLSIISAVCIGIASLGFLLITQIFEKILNRLKDTNDEIISRQKEARDYLYEAIYSRHTLLLLNDHYDILSKVIQSDKTYFAEREKRLISVSSGSAQDSLNAALASEVIDQTSFNAESEKVKKSVSIPYHYEIYKRYTEKAGEGTKLLDMKRLKNQSRIRNITSVKNALLSLFFLLQSVGLAIAVYVIGTND
ncbi:MAG: hypothetical protein M1495_00350 [Bacteroidetes bacterium]|nr:hypothetical protein [Bacteroidota bacterium]